MPRRSVIGLALAAAALAACGTENESAAPPASPEPTATGQPADGRYATGEADLEVVVHCAGRGSPTVIFEAGDGGGIDQFSRMADTLGERTTACAYDRLGAGGSDAPTETRRTAADVIAVLRDLIAGAKLPAPFVLVGSSAGGNLAMEFARRHPDSVAGVVLIDVGAPTGTLGEEFPGSMGWDNPEHLDYVQLDRAHARRPPDIGDVPLVILTASDGDTRAADARYWSQRSSRAKRKTLEGGHDLHEDDPDAVLAEIESLLEAS